jgi:uncharacterized protein (TIGR02246 family)
MSLEQVGRNWIAGWNSRDSEAFSRRYAPDGEYVDPSFGIRRKGRDLVRMHHEIWWKAIPDFAMKARHIHVADRSVIVEVTAEGTVLGRRSRRRQDEGNAKSFQWLVDRGARCERGRRDHGMS